MFEKEFADFAFLEWKNNRVYASDSDTHVEDFDALSYSNCFSYYNLFGVTGQ